MRNLVAESEIIVFYANAVGLHPGAAECWDEGVPVTDYSPESWQPYGAAVVDIIHAILELRQGAPTILRAADLYCSVHVRWRRSDSFDECKEFWDNREHSIRLAAETRNVPVANFYDEFNGPDHLEDPRDKGYIRPDGESTSEAGQRAMARVLRELGYEFTVPAAD